MTHCRLCRFVRSSRIRVESDTLRRVVSMMMMASASERTKRGSHFFMRVKRRNVEWSMLNVECLRLIQHSTFNIRHDARVQPRLVPPQPSRPNHLGPPRFFMNAECRIENGEPLLHSTFCILHSAFLDSYNRAPMHAFNPAWFLRN